MNKISIKEIIDACNGILIKGSTNDFIEGVKHDSRECMPGDMFVAVVGENQDGHKYIPGVVKSGCKTLLVSHERGWHDELPDTDINIIKVDDTVRAMGMLAKYYLETLNVPKVAVTGSVGKTSVRDMIYYVLSEKYNCGRNMKNYNNFIGLPLSIFQFDDKTEVVVLEMGMDKFGEIDYLANIVKPNIAVITNIGVAHMENLGSQEGIFKAKMEVAEHLCGWQGKTPSNNKSATTGTLIFAEDKTFLTRQKTAGNYGQVIIGNSSDCEYILSEVDDFGLEGIKFNLKHRDASNSFKLEVPGKHNAVNASIAIAVGNQFGIDYDMAQEGLLKAELTGRRLKLVRTDKISIIDDTYNASPDSVKSALTVLDNSRCDGKKIAVLADMLELGDGSEMQHYDVGAFAATLGIDMIVTVGEAAKKIAQAADEQGKNSYSFDDKQSAMQFIRTQVDSGDVVLVKGSRGMKMEQIVEGLREIN